MFLYFRSCEAVSVSRLGITVVLACQEILSLVVSGCGLYVVKQSVSLCSLFFSGMVYSVTHARAIVELGVTNLYQ